MLPGEARPQPASRGGGGPGRREKGWGSPVPELAARPPEELRPRSLSPSRSRCLGTGKFSEGPGDPRGQRVPGCGGGSPQSPPLGSPRFVSGRQRLGRAGSAGAGSPSHSLAAPGERHGACSLAQPELCLNQPFSIDFGDNLCFLGPVCGLGLGQGWHRGRGLRRLSELQVPPCLGRLRRLRGDRAAAPAREEHSLPGCGLSPLEKRVPPRCVCWEPSPWIAVFNWLQGWPGAGQGRSGHAEPRAARTLLPAVLSPARFPFPSATQI